MVTNIAIFICKPEIDLRLKKFKKLGLDCLKFLPLLLTIIILF